MSAATQTQVDQRSTADIVAVALSLAAQPDTEQDDSAVDPYWSCIGELHRRGGQAEFDAAAALLASPAGVERSLGASILGQLGYGKTFKDESVSLLIEALSDQDQSVIASAAHALGHRHSDRAIEPLLQLIGHISADIRDAVAHGLSCLDDRRATDGLIALSRDSDNIIRDWTSFYLGELCIIDYPELRAALHDLLADSEPVVRGQALIGLSRRGDRSCVGAVRSELAGTYNGIWAVNAAGYLADTTLLTDLESLLRRESANLPSWHLNDFRDAIEACRSGTPNPVDR
jgi:HEAT repeat protein